MSESAAASANARPHGAPLCPRAEPARHHGGAKVQATRRGAPYTSSFREPAPPPAPSRRVGNVRTATTRASRRRPALAAGEELVSRPTRQLLRLRRAVGPPPPSRPPRARSRLTRARRRHHRACFPPSAATARANFASVSRARRLRPLAGRARARRAAEDEPGGSALSSISHAARSRRAPSRASGSTVVRLFSMTASGSGRRHRRQRQLRASSPSSATKDAPVDAAATSASCAFAAAATSAQWRARSPSAASARAFAVSPSSSCASTAAAAHEPEVGAASSERPTLQFEAGARRRHVEQQPTRRPRAGTRRRRRPPHRRGGGCPAVGVLERRRGRRRHGAASRSAYSGRAWRAPGGRRQRVGAQRAPPSPGGDALGRAADASAASAAMPFLVSGGKRFLLLEGRGCWRRQVRAVGRVGPPLADRRAPPPPPPPRAPWAVQAARILRQPRQRRRRPLQRARVPRRARGSTPRAAPPPPASPAALAAFQPSVTFSRRSRSRRRWRARRQRTQWWTPVAIARRARVFAANDASRRACR